MRLLLLILLCGPLCAQSFDETRCRFLSSPHARTGTWAPYRAALSNLDGQDTITVQSIAPGVVLEKQVAVAGTDTTEVILPVFVHEGAILRVGDAELRPELPTRRVDADFARAYTAVFSNDPVYARGVVPSTPSGAVCDYYELREFFTDWRLFDGYDAIIIFNPGGALLPAGSQQAIAEFCSLGGVVIVAGSFLFGERGVNVPPPQDPTLPVFRGVRARRMGYGPGAIYRFGYEELRTSGDAHAVLIAALRDHTWFGADNAPGGTPPVRVAPVNPPHPQPLPLQESRPTLLFWGFAGALLLVCGLVPVVAARVSRRKWLPPALVAAGCAGIGGVATLQQSPLPPLEITELFYSGEGEPASARMLVQVERTWGDTLVVNLNSEVRDLPRAVPSLPGWSAWAVDRPLVGLPADREPAVELQRGRVGGQVYRDFATSAHRGNTGFSTAEAAVVEWWLEENAYRGRSASLAPVAAPEMAFKLDGTTLRERGAIRVTPLRE